MTWLVLTFRRLLNLAACFALALALTAPVDCFAQAKAADSKSSDSAETVYRNASLGFRYQIPFGWVDRTQEMQEDQTDNAASESAKTKRTLKAKNEVLLAVFEHPPEATTNDINSAVVIATESAASYPGLKTAEDYAGPLTEIVTSKGFKAEGAPYGVDEDSRHFARVDFIKILASQSESNPLVMHQSTLILLAKGQIVSFTFIAGSDDELDELMDALHFGASANSAKQTAH